MAKKAAAKSAPSHPPYIDERSGVSHYAIAKCILEQQKFKDLPSNFKKLLFIQLKKFVASGKASTKKSTTAPAAEKPKAVARKQKIIKSLVKKVTAVKKTTVMKNSSSPVKKVTAVKKTTVMKKTSTNK